MAGIYIHIPFCKQACHYCDFHFSTSLKNKNVFIKALKKEIEIQKKYLETDAISTVYFGGGTPSLLSEGELSDIFETLYVHFKISADAEITLEANPDDLTDEKIKSFKKVEINRLSIGIQSFYDVDLKLMNRAHNSGDAKRSVKLAQDNGIENITIDLIYGIPTLTNENWKNNLHTAFELGVKHISAYCLTVEPQTALAYFVKKGIIKNVDEQKSIEQFEIMLEEMSSNGFVQYEISNFCKNDFYSRHNSNYWLKEKYLGLGPSAHSYNGNSRQWNIANNVKYIKALEQGKLDFESEVLNSAQQYNEYILTSLRTMWGTDLNFIEKKFGFDSRENSIREAEKYIRSGDIVRSENKLILSDKGKLIADKISGDLFKQQNQ